MTRLSCVILMLLIAGCSRQSTQADVGGAPAQQRERGKFLAYQHAVTIDTEENKIQPLMARLVAACEADRDNGCTLLSSSVEGGRRSVADLRVRAKAPGIAKLVALASSGGELARRETSVEDLARPVADNAKRLEMLRAYQQKLSELERKPGLDADSLIKLSKEQAGVQAELEQANGENVHLMERINLDVLSVHIQALHQQSFWGPVQRALADFGGNLSEGIASAVTGLAYIVPWSLVLLLVWWLGRKLWRRARR